jgi:heme/copper-type cytochrome/quinol oxidase subunit 2
MTNNVTILVLVGAAFGWMFFLTLLFGEGVRIAREKGHYDQDWRQQHTREWLALVITPGLLVILVALVLALAGGGEA